MEAGETLSEKQWQEWDRRETVLLAGVSKMRDVRRPKLRIVKGGKR
jgi:hypothetical protein